MKRLGPGQEPDNPYRDEMAELLADVRRRMSRLEAAVAGRATVKRVRVRAYDVPAYSVGGHWRLITQLPPKPKPARKPASKTKPPNPGTQ